VGAAVVVGCADGSDEDDRLARIPGWLAVSDLDGDRLAGQGSDERGAGYRVTVKYGPVVRSF